MLPEIRVVLSHPLFHGNLGSVARVCANFGVTDVVLVHPEASANHAEALRYASGAPSKEILASMKTAASVQEAIADCALSLAFARKENRAPHERDYSALSWGAIGAGGRVALVFGKEDHGLSDEEIAACSFECMIESAELHPTLNLSHAVAAVLHTLTREAPSQSEAKLRTTTPVQRWIKTTAMEPEDGPATMAATEETIAHWRQLLVDAGITTGNNPEQLLNPMAAALKRATLSQREVGYFRAFFSKVQNAIKHGGGTP